MWTRLLMRFMSLMCVTMETVTVLLSVFFLPGALAACSNPSHLFITTPQTMGALSGSCLLIPCNFTATTGAASYDSSRPVYGMWSKNQPTYSTSGYDYLIYNSSNTVIKYPMNITGNLSQNICTTLMFNVSSTYTDSYYFRIDNGAFVATADCNPVTIAVNDSAPSPRIQLPADLTENQSVTISCSAPTPCPLSPPQLTWSLQQDPHNNMEGNPDGTFTTKIQETITLSDQHDGSNISCSATYPVNGGDNNKTAGTQVTLSVSYAPKNTSASISPSGSWVNLTCSSRAKPPVSSFTWFQISTDGAVTVSEGAFYRVNATRGGVYYCVASNGVGNQTSPQIRLPVISCCSTISQWEPVLGVILGIILLICLIVCVWRLKSTRKTAQQTQSGTAEEPNSKKEEVENIHYGEIAIIELRPEASSGSVKDGGQQTDTVYAHVKVSNTESSSPPTTDGTEDAYSQVKK